MLETLFEFYTYYEAGSKKQCRRMKLVIDLNEGTDKQTYQVYFVSKSAKSLTRQLKRNTRLVERSTGNIILVEREERTQLKNNMNLKLDENDELFYKFMVGDRRPLFCKEEDVERYNRESPITETSEKETVKENLAEPTENFVPDIGLKGLDGYMFNFETEQVYKPTTQTHSGEKNNSTGFASQFSAVSTLFSGSNESKSLPETIIISTTSTEQTPTMPNPSELATPNPNITTESQSKKHKYPYTGRAGEEIASKRKKTKLS